MKSLEELWETPNLMIREIGQGGGRGIIWRAGREWASVIWSDGGGWEHVSVCPFKRSYTPSWDDMCRLKNMFFHEDEVVVQFHPAKNDYVNNLPNCLHLWRPLNEEMPIPPSILVGIRDGQSTEEALKEIKEVGE